MREGTRTVLAMPNNYEGPPERLRHGRPGAGRAPEGRREDAPARALRPRRRSSPRRASSSTGSRTPARPRRPTTPTRSRRARPRRRRPRRRCARGGPTTSASRVEAQFTVGEYQVRHPRRARTRPGLDTWLHEQRLQASPTARRRAPALRAGGMKFFVAKVDVAKVQLRRAGTRACSRRCASTTTPTTFCAAGAARARSTRPGTQDLVVHILAPRPALRGRQLRRTPPSPPTSTSAERARAPVRRRSTRRSSTARSTQHPRRRRHRVRVGRRELRPVPRPARSTPSELATLGADVLPARGDRSRRWRGFVLTRLHARYSRDSLGEDLVFRAAPPIQGGREVRGEGARSSAGCGRTRTTTSRPGTRSATRGPSR